MPAAGGLAVTAVTLSSPLTEDALSIYKNPTCNRIYEQCFFWFRTHLQLVLTCDLCLDSLLCKCWPLPAIVMPARHFNFHHFQRRAAYCADVGCSDFI